MGLPLDTLKGSLRVGNDVARKEAKFAVPLALVKENAGRAVAGSRVEESGANPVEVIPAKA